LTKKKVKLWQYLLICVLFDVVTITFVLPYIFKTNVPFSVDYLLGACIFVVWSALQAIAGYFITRG
jgi:hypothetical protein